MPNPVITFLIRHSYDQGTRSSTSAYWQHFYIVILHCKVGVSSVLSTYRP